MGQEHIPDDVKRILRREVKFGCPVRDCRSPYLTWHHFDPPRRVRHHNNPDGMIALCRKHHDKADHGSYTTDQLHDMKKAAASYDEKIEAHFDWMRRDIIAVIGSCYFRNPEYVFSFNGKRCFWIKRDADYYALFNLSLPISNDEIFLMEDNFWSVDPSVKEVICPPSGKRLEIKLKNDDWVKITFREIQDSDSAMQRYPLSNSGWWQGLELYPITTCEVLLNMPSIGIKASPKGIEMPRGNFFHNIYSLNARNGLDLC